MTSFDRNRMSNSGADAVQQMIEKQEIKNTYYLSHPRRLQKTTVHRLLRIFLNNSAPLTPTYELVVPEKIERKLEYNEAIRFKLKLNSFTANFLTVESALNDLENSEKIIRKLERLFIEHAVLGQDNKPMASRGDDILRSMEESLKTLLENDPDFDQTNAETEDLEEFCIGLLAVGIYKCKVLVKPREVYTDALT